MAGELLLQSIPILANNCRASIYWFLVFVVFLPIAHCALATGNGWVKQLVSGFFHCSSRIGRAFLIGKYVATFEVRSFRDYFNTIAPGVAQGTKCELARIASYLTVWQK